jgi:hypothetical protein
VPDRFGRTDGAIQVKSNETAWRLPPGIYFKGDTTLTMWVKKIECRGIYGSNSLIYKISETDFIEITLKHI